MRRAALIYNPVSGSNHADRVREVELAAAELRGAGVAADMVATESAGAAAQQAIALTEAGYDTLFACGGDGTVHEVLQGLVESRSQAALGVIPLGTGNALANDLGIPWEPAQAARRALQFEPRRVSAGRIDYAIPENPSQTRYFTVMAGVGADAEMLYKVTASHKKRFGINAYYAYAIKTYLTHHFPSFEVEFQDVASADGTRRREKVTQMMAVRIGTFGGLVKRLAPGAGLERDDVRLVLFKTGNRLVYLLYSIGTIVNWHLPIPGVELLSATDIECRLLPEEKERKRSKRIYSEADGELLGPLPVKIRIVPDAFTLLMPPISEPDAAKS